MFNTEADSTLSRLGTETWVNVDLSKLTAIERRFCLLICTDV